MDNASFHKSPKIQQLIEARGAKLLYLPTYSPDLNPIEHCWYPLKVAIKKANKIFIDFEQSMRYIFSKRITTRDF
jgi:transposase